VPPSSNDATPNVVFAREDGKPAPTVRYGTSVCQP
jgi:hypothetical protein